jgi:hypothetical protein
MQERSLFVKRLEEKTGPRLIRLIMDNVLPE